MAELTPEQEAAAAKAAAEAILNDPKTTKEGMQKFADGLDDQIQKNPRLEGGITRKVQKAVDEAVKKKR